MCGIIGVIGKSDVAPILMDGLKRLEYRGYDSAGIATLTNEGIERRRAEGKLINLGQRIKEKPLRGTTGIGHTRWATHGVPNEKNAHPHATDKVVLVHNGIIENFQELKKEVLADGASLSSETDTEVVAHLITGFLNKGDSPEIATSKTLKRLRGAFSLGILFSGKTDLMIAARRGTPLAIGVGEGEMFLGSDALALAQLTKKIIYLEDGDWAIITASGATIFDENNKKIDRPVRLTELSGATVGKGGYDHFMLKEIYEQPQVIGDTLHSYINPSLRRVSLGEEEIDLSKIEKVTIIACGTSYYAALVAKYWIESLVRITVEVDVASEFRYREATMPVNGLAIFISQSGETLDTLAALRYAQKQKQVILSIVNVPESTIARESEFVLQTYAGPEVGVASTKAFTTQLTVLACLTLALGRALRTVNSETEANLADALAEVPARAAEVLNHDERIKELATEIAKARDVLYLGRGVSYPIALEGALKLKEISYIHAEGYAAGEMKHGPIALIDDGVPVIVIAPKDDLFEKTASNMQEVIARGAKVLLVTNKSKDEVVSENIWEKIEVESTNDDLLPFLLTIPLQKLAYYSALKKGFDIDKPRNLAKSVTVE